MAAAYLRFVATADEVGTEPGSGPPGGPGTGRSNEARAKVETRSGSLLLVLPVPLRRGVGGALEFESQACNGLERWAENFDRLVVACPLAPEREWARGDRNATYLPVDALPSRDRIEFVPLPWAYRTLSFLKAYRGVRKTLADAIRRCDFLQFAIGGLGGDWASVAALEAIRQRRRFAIWTDRVEHRVARTSHGDVRGVRRAYRKLRGDLIVSPLMKRLERHLIRRSNLGLFHGADCYEAYAAFCPRPFLVHNVHLKPEDRVDVETMRGKARRARAGEPLRLVYAGRAAAMKGPIDWLRALADLKGRGVRFQARWLGEGPLLDEMKREVERLDLGGFVELPGFVGDREAVTRAFREADLFVFCHKTPESPRCLIEALIAACPIVGYDGAYQRDLLAGAGDAPLTPVDDPAALARRIAELDADREVLGALIERSYELGADYSDVAVFRRRGDLIKEHLGPVAAAVDSRGDDREPSTVRGGIDL